MHYAKLLICAIVSFCALCIPSARAGATDWTNKMETSSTADNATDTLSACIFHDIRDSRLKTSAPLAEVCLAIDSLLAKNDLKHVRIQGYSSPSGPVDLNGKLAWGRAEEVRKYLLSNSNLAPSMTSISATAEDWSGFREAVESDTEIEGRKMILDILDSNVSTKQKEREIRTRVSRKDWRRMCDHIFPALRRTVILVIYKPGPVEVELEIKEDPVIETRVEPEVEFEPEEIIDDNLFPNDLRTESVSPAWERSPGDEEELHWYLKTNVPAWAMLWLNITAEFDFARHWSAQLPIYYSGFDYFKRTRKYRTFTIMPEVRWWPRRGNGGFFAGVHFGLAYYNVAFEGKYRYQDHDGTTPALGGGVSVGYRLPISRNHRWHLEFSVGAGVYSLDYDLFENVPNGQLVDRRKRTFFGIDNAAISVGYRFGLAKKQPKQKKGGAE